jgi:hypothetical protein
MEKQKAIELAYGEYWEKVMEYNLSVNEVYLLDYKKSIIKHCNC